MPTAPVIHGTCDQRFAGVRDAIEANFADHDELGAAVAISLDGVPVVDLWAGWMDTERRRQWRADTLVDVFSVGKAVAAVCLLMLVDRGSVDLDVPVASYWPEFAAEGKEEATVRMLLAHRAGLPAIRRSLPDEAMYDWTFMCDALAGEEPWWTPGERHGYHVNTFGFLVGEIVRRVSGITIGEFLRNEIARPLGAQFSFGVDGSSDRVADYVLAGVPARPLDTAALAALLDEARGGRRVGGEAAAGDVGSTEDRNLLLQRTYFNPPGISGLGTVDTQAWRTAEMPSTNGYASARGVCRIYSALALGGEVDGVRLLEPETLDQAIEQASAGTDVVLGRNSRFGLGFQLTQSERRLGPNPRSFGHFGAGGSLGFADPDAGLAFGYTMNRAGPRWQNPRNRALIEAAYANL